MMNARISIASFVGLLLFSLSVGMAQTPAIDSLKRAFAGAQEDSVRQELTAEISKEFMQLQADSALVWARRGREISQRIGSEDALGKGLYHLGLATFNKQNFPVAMNYYKQAAELFENTGNERWRIDAECEIGTIYLQMGDFEEARRYIDRSHRYYLKTEDAHSIIYSLNLYNMLYEQMGETDSMLFYAKETLEAAQKYNLPKYLAKIHNNLAATYLYRDNFADAKIHFREAEKIGFGDDVSGRYFNRYARAEMYRSLGQLDSSVIFANRALETARKFGDLARESQMHKFLSDVYLQKGDYKNAYDELRTFTFLTDSLTMMRHEANISELSIQYETQQKEAQIAQQELQLEREANRRNLILFGSLALLLTGGGVFFFLQNRQRVRQQQAEIDLKLKASEAEQLRELNQMKSNFFANISHEFRTPLTLMLSPLREMFNGTFTGDTREYQKMMIRNGERLLGLVNQLLDLSRLESGRMQLDTQAADLTKFVRSVVFSFESWAMRKQIFFQTNFPEQPIIALFDSDKLEKILSNLLSNAFKFTPDKGRITFDMAILNQTNERAELEIKVRDTGPGIPPEQLPHIFERFYSQPREEQDKQGSGIGLALTKELIELHGGSIEVASDPGRGTQFTMVLPFQLAKAIATTIAAPPMIEDFTEAETPEAFQRTNSRKPILLVVEDNPDLRSYIKDQLREGYQLVEAVNGKQGLELATEIIPDLVLTDVMMPEMDGMTLCRTLKDDERTSHVPVIMLTARSDQQDKLSGLSTGADAYLTKPFDPQELQIMVKNLIEQRRKLREKFAEGFAKPQQKLDFVSPAEDAFLKKVAEAVEKHLDDEDFSIEDLGKAVGMSRSQLHRKIKAITDQSPSVFVRTLRLQHAYRLLERRAGNISEVAFQVGIPNLAYFSRSFSEQFGFPPSELLHKEPS